MTKLYLFCISLWGVNVAFAADAVALPSAPIDTVTIIAICGTLWSIASEILAYLPGIKANGVVQLIMNILGKVAGKTDKI